MCLVILSRIGEYIIFGESLCVETPFCVHIDDRISSLCLLCCDHDHTVGTTGTIERVGCSVLEDCHRLDVRRVDVVDVSVIRNTIHYVKRCVAGID